MDQTSQITETNTTSRSTTNGTPNNNMPKYLLAGGALVLVLAGLFMYASANSDTASQDEQEVLSAQNENTEVTQDEETDMEEDMEMSADATEFTVNGKNFEYMPTEIRVKQGDTVRIVFNNTDGFHDWVLDEFSASTKQIQAGESDTIEFVADKAGEFEYYCSVGSHKDMGMVGKLIVE